MEVGVAELPTGTVTFLFSDIEGSTRLWELHPDGMRVALAQHDEVLRAAIESHRGAVVKQRGDGFHAAFATADDAVLAAVAAQVALKERPWGETGPLLVRIGLHTGTAEARDGDYYGSVLNRGARLEAAAHGGQIICSQATADLAREALPSGFEFVDLGEHRLRDLSRPEVVFQVKHPDLPAEFLPLRTLDAFPGNLPIERTALIGRSRELDKLARALDAQRLVTLTGVGGVGKTRLALQLAADVLDRFPDGAWFVALASIRDPVLVPGAVARALEIAERPGRSLSETLRDAIGTRRLLVVLDNCEHLLDATARLVDDLLDGCLAIRIVATSREALGVEGEQSWPTPSLGLPADEASKTVADRADGDAVTLFVERARGVRPDFEMTAANASAVAALCSRLDGIPLAIELAAARVGALAPRDILERIDQRFLLLTGGSRTALERHQTLQAAVDWSYDLLAERERRLFERLSVFAGGFTLDAASAVAAEADMDEVAVVDGLGSLVAKSMVIADRSGDSVRYRLLETLRQYSRDRLTATGDAAAVRDQHARYFLKFVETLRPAFLGPDQAEAYDSLSTEIDNVRAAFNWLLETGDPAAALRLINGFTVSNTGELLRLREAALAAAADLPPADLIEPLARTAYDAMSAGEHARASELAEASLARSRAAGLPPHARAFEALGLVAFWHNDPTRAVEALEQAIALARAADDGSVQRRFDYAASVASLGFVLGRAGETERAIIVGQEALGIVRELRVPSMLSAALFQLALAYQSSDPAHAAQLLDESLEHQLDAWSYGRSWTLVAAGQVREALGEHAAALGAFGEVLALSRQSGERFVAPVALQGMARALRHLDRLDEAATLLGAADGLAERLAIAGGEADTAARSRAATRLRDLLGDERFDAHWHAGRTLSFDAALAAGLAAAAGVPPKSS
ncbi:MAG TPA: adenylate/guanylate cyclase domain-containing protein [Acidimicrobiia bacterium]|nr:adenylate/guanylate cyclase domain-containing protein [Acidimicrobiia bacterium]